MINELPNYDNYVGLVTAIVEVYKIRASMAVNPSDKAPLINELVEFTVQLKKTANAMVHGTPKSEKSE